MSTKTGFSLPNNRVMARRSSIASAVAAATVMFSGLGLLATTGQAHAAAVSATPISVTGFNQDSIVENSYTVSSANGGYIPSSVAVPFAAVTGGSGNVLYESGLGGSASGTGLPTNHTLTGAAFSSDLNVGFQLQNYTNTDNVLNLTTTTNELNITNGSTGTLTFANPASYQGLAILAMGTRGGGEGASGQVTLNFTDGTSVTTDYAARDWYSVYTDTFTPDGNPYAYAATNVGRISTTNSSFSSGVNMDETILNLANLSNGTTTANYTGKTIASLTFTQAPNSGSSNIFAVSGFTQALPNTAPMAPIAVTGFNQNGVVPNTYTGTNTPLPTTVAQPINGPGSDDYALFEAGISGASTTNGLPVNGSLTSPFAGTSHVSGPATFQLQPYTGNSVLNLNHSAGTGTGTLTLTTPGKFSKIAILAVRDDGSATESVTLTFANGSTVTTDFQAMDWYSPGSGTTADGNDYGVAASNLGRMDTLNSSLQTSGVALTETVLNLADLSNGTTFGNYSDQTLVSMLFSDPSSSGATDILAVSGTAVPEPAALALLLCASGVLLLRRRRA